MPSLLMQARLRVARHFALLALLLLVVTQAHPAAAAACREPTPAAYGQRFYLDAAHGDDRATGRTPGTAWRSFAAVFPRGQLNPAIHFGDTVLLADGAYGAVFIRNVGHDNGTRFLRFAPRPGQKPVIASLVIASSERLEFRGLRFRSQSGIFKYTPLVRIQGSADMPTRDIRIVGNDLASADDVSRWTQQDWVDRAAYGGIIAAGRPTDATTCVQLLGNTIRNVGNGIALQADRSEVIGNNVDNFGLDGIDFAANDIVLSRNTISNSNTIGVGNHNDMMQGLRGEGDGPGGTGPVTFSNVVITRNMILRYAGRGPAFPGSIQGIDGFAGNWRNLLVANNVVILGGPKAVPRRVFYNRTDRAGTDNHFAVQIACRRGQEFTIRRAGPGIAAGNVDSLSDSELGLVPSCTAHGITFGSIQHGNIVNNTVLADNPAANLLGIHLSDRSATGSGSCDVLVANNIVTFLGLDGAFVANLAAPAGAAVAAGEANCAPDRPRNFQAGNVVAGQGAKAGKFVVYDPAGAKGTMRPNGAAPLLAVPASGVVSLDLLRRRIGAEAAVDVAGRPRRSAKPGAWAR